ncbi:MAG: hypothetical protein ACOZBW_07710 [Thermodesulfobacteriota bacterium]
MDTGRNIQYLQAGNAAATTGGGAGESSCPGESEGLAAPEEPFARGKPEAKPRGAVLLVFSLAARKVHGEKKERRFFKNSPYIEFDFDTDTDPDFDLDKQIK